MQNYFGYSYFRKPASEIDGTEEEIFCDDASRLDMMKRVFKGRMIPLLVIFFAVIVPQTIAQTFNGISFSYGVVIALYIMFAIYIGIFISFAVSYWKYYKSIHK